MEEQNHSTHPQANMKHHHSGYVSIGIFLGVVIGAFAAGTLVMNWQEHMRAQELALEQEISDELRQQLTRALEEKNGEIMAMKEEIKNGHGGSTEHGKLIALNDQWNLYVNDRFGFSLDVPRIAQQHYCVEGEYAPGSVVRESMDQSVSVFELEDRVIVSGDFYDVERREGDTVICEHVPYKGEQVIIDDTDPVYPKQELIFRDIDPENRDEEIQAFVNDMLSFSQCEVVGYPERGEGAIRLNTTGPGGGCFINWIAILEYSATHKRAYYTSLGQDPGFVNEAGDIVVPKNFQFRSP